AMLLSFSFAIFTTFVSNNLWSRFEHRDDSIRQQFAILAGQNYYLNDIIYYFPMFQNRVFFASILKFFSLNKSLTVSKWFLLLRLFSAWAAFLVFFYLLHRVARLNVKLSSLGLLFLAYELIFTFNHGYEHATDFPDVMFISLFIWMAMRKQRVALFILSIIAASNRESSAFAGVIWIFYHGLSDNYRIKIKELLYGLFLSASSYGTVMALRYAIGGAKVTYMQGIGGIDNIMLAVREFMHNPTNASPLVLFAAMVIPLFFWIYGNRASIKPLHIRLMLAAAVIEIASIQLAFFSELRTAIPFMVVMVFCALLIEGESVYLRERKQC
ncbi:MAG: hypothetical protein KKE64_02650, partial [Candidatus Omnitrophica bacterium]|nr:hypothetical protein [Candidatus Omnitrophota bacterium]